MYRKEALQNALKEDDNMISSSEAMQSEATMTTTTCCCCSKKRMKKNKMTYTDVDAFIFSVVLLWFIILPSLLRIGSGALKCYTVGFDATPRTGLYMLPSFLNGLNIVKDKAMQTANCQRYSREQACQNHDNCAWEDEGCVQQKPEMYIFISFSPCLSYAIRSRFGWYII